MSLIPYNSEGESHEVVLRHQSTLVLYDPKRRQLALRKLSDEPQSQALDRLSQCPYCHRPFSHGHDVPDAVPPGAGHGGLGDEPGFVDQNYFRMLETSLRLPPNGPPLSAQRPPPSPTRRRLPIPARVEDIDDNSSIAGGGALGSDQTSPRRASTGGIDSAAFSPGYFERFFVTEGELGRGGKGVVLLVRHMLDGVFLGHFACKRVPVGDNHEWLEKVLTEVQLLQRLSHTNLVSYRHVWLESVRITNFGPTVPCAFILQQYCNGGDLHNYVLKSVSSHPSSKEELKERMRRRSRGQPEIPTSAPRRLPFEQIISFFKDVTAGLSHLHANGFIHRDLKPSNCLLTDPGIPGQPPRVLVSDFGEVQMETAMRNSSGATGTISYCAPEVLERIAPGGRYGNFTTKSDIFSLGMILYFMCFGNLPYENADSMNEENEDLDGLRAEITAWTGMVDKERLRPDLPDRLYRSLERLLSPNPANRPSAEEILLGLNMGMGLAGDDGSPMRGSHSPTRPVMDEEAGSSSPRPNFRRISPISDTPPISSRSNSPRRKAYSTFNGNNNSNNSTPEHNGKNHHGKQASTQPNRSSNLRGLPISPPPQKLQPIGDLKFPPPKLNLPSDSSTDSSTTTESADEITTTTVDAGASSSLLILRPRIDTPQSLSRVPHHLLPPLARRDRLVAMVRAMEYGMGVKLAVFLAKAISLTSPCSPLVPNPWFYYPLLTLAALDLTMTTMKASIVLLGIHITVLLMGSASKMLCLYY